MGDAQWDQRAPHRDIPPVPAPPPYTGQGRVIRVTSAEDGLFAPRMMSDRANVYLNGGAAFVFCASVAGGPQLYTVDLASGSALRIGPLPYMGETEGWYWSPKGRIVRPQGAQLLSIDPSDLDDVDILLDISLTHPGCDLWQPHSSDDGNTHSATVRQITAEGRYPYLGTAIQSPYGFRFEPAMGQLDESQVTRSGSHVIIKQNGEDNRIINLASGEIWDLSDADGALGHSDCGPDFIVGEANLPGPGRCVKVDLLTRERTTLFETNNMGYVSMRGGRCLLSDSTHLSLVALDGSGVTAMLPHGGGAAYDDRVKANLDPSGRIACYMVGGSVYLLELA